LTENAPVCTGNVGAAIVFHVHLVSGSINFLHGAISITFLSWRGTLLIVLRSAVHHMFFLRSTLQPTSDHNSKLPC